MLTAQTKTGDKICLGLNYGKEALMNLREKEDFICPICGEGVILKLGNQRIFHFAHKSEGICREFYEPETAQHLEGKRSLYQWLISKKIPAVLEYYDREIEQRPDILFKHNGRKYALEFQCSPLPDKVFSKRNRSYLEHDYIPLWIICSSHIQRKRSNIFSLSNFDYLFIRTSPSGNYYIPSFCPDKQQFQIVKSICPISIKNAFAEFSVYPLERITLDGLLSPTASKTQFPANWNKEVEKFILNWGLHPSPKQNAFLHEIYKHNLNLFLLPPEIGLPVPHSFLIHTPTVIWQTYLFLDVIARKQLNEMITLKEINHHFQKRIKRNEVIIRYLPQLAEVNPIAAEIDYLHRLVQLGILSKKEEAVFQLQRKILLPTSNREREEAKRDFNQKYQHVLLKS